MLTKRLAAACAFGAMALAACSDNGALNPGNATDEQREEITLSLEESGFFQDEFGVDGLYDDGALAPMALMAAQETNGVEVTLPDRWGRRLGPPVRRSVQIDVDEVEGIAVVTKRLVFRGQFLMALSNTDTEASALRKPMNVTLIHHARFRRLSTDQATDVGRRWVLVGVSPAQLIMTAEDAQTIQLARVEMWAGDRQILLIEDPNELLEIDSRIPMLELGTEVTVKAWVRTDGSGTYVPDAFVFLHVRHARPDVRDWKRMQMEFVDSAEGGYYLGHWTAHQWGRALVAVDAIDSKSFVAEQDYSGNAWGVPYRIPGPEGQENDTNTDG